MKFLRSVGIRGRCVIAANFIEIGQTVTEIPRFVNVVLMLKVLLPVASLFKCNFSHGYAVAVVDKIFD